MLLRSSHYGWPLFARLLSFLIPITFLVWIFFGMFGFRYISNRARVVFMETNMKIVHGIAQQSVMNINYSDLFQLKRTLSDFFDDTHMDCIAIYSRRGRPLAVHPSDLSSQIIAELQVALDTGGTRVKEASQIAGGRFSIRQEIRDAEGKHLGNIVMIGSTYPLSESVRSQIIIYALLGAVLLIINVALITYFARRVTKPFTRLTGMLREFGTEENPRIVPPPDRTRVLGKNPCSEVVLFYDTYRRMMTNIGEHQKRERLMAIQASIGTIASHLSHDMRTPLHNIKTFLNALPVIDDQDLSQLKGGATRSVQKLIGMTEELVDYAKANRVAPVPTKLCVLLADTIKELSSSMTEKDIPVELSCPEDLQADVDPGKMSRVFSNIIFNAVQAISKPGCVISIKARYSGNVVVISIVDDGPGIEPQHIPHLFDSSFTYGKRRGTGLGLSYCQKVVHAHHGSIHVESEQGRGSVFSIMLPLKQQKGELGEERLSRAEHELAVSRMPIRNILIVDDDPSILTHWRIIFKKFDITPVEATSLEDLQVRAMDFGTIDTAIVDYQFEGSAWTGLDVLAFLKEKGVAHMYMCTGFYQDEEVTGKAMSLGVIKVLPKPFDETIVNQLL